jgi:hypothetical protein
VRSALQKLLMLGCPSPGSETACSSIQWWLLRREDGPLLYDCDPFFPPLSIRQAGGAAHLGSLVVQKTCFMPGFTTVLSAAISAVFYLLRRFLIIL